MNRRVATANHTITIKRHFAPKALITIYKLDISYNLSILVIILYDQGKPMESNGLSLVERTALSIRVSYPHVPHPYTHTHTHSMQHTSCKRFIGGQGIQKAASEQGRKRKGEALKPPPH